MNISLKNKVTKSLVILTTVAMISCGGGSSSSSSNDDDTDIGVDGLDSSITASAANAVISNYASIVYANYVESRDFALDLQLAIDEFLADPSEANLELAKQAWKEAREPYGQTEVYRFYDGPIDDAENENAPEGRLNAWPLDEREIDYVISGGNVINSGIINDPAFTLTKDNISNQNETNNSNGNPNESAIYTGYHAIEFMLWGQDRSLDSAGERPASDFAIVLNNNNEPDNNDPRTRRRVYLEIITDLLVEDLDYLVNAWAPGVSNNYRAQFLALHQKEALRRMIRGVGELSGGELAGERMNVALNVNNGDQEDEHSCFSDNTHRDIATNFGGALNIYYGTYTRQDGTTVGDGNGLEDLFNAVNSELTTTISTQVENLQSRIDALSEDGEGEGNNRAPFDVKISPNNDAGRLEVQNIIDGLSNQITQGNDNKPNGFVENLSIVTNEMGINPDLALQGD